MNKQYLYVILLALIPVIMFLNTWQGVAVFSVILGYTAFLEFMDRKEEVNKYNKRIEVLEDNVKLNNEKITELRTKVGINSISKTMIGR